MRVYIPLLAFLLLGASAPCGTAPLSAGTYGFPGYSGPPIFESATSEGGRITVTQALGDRMFTEIISTYDRKTLTLLSMERHASCCGSHWQADVTRNADGTYDVEAQMTWPSPNAQDVYKESRPHMYLPPGAFINSGGFFFVPWIYHMTRASNLVQLSFSPLRTEDLRISQTPATPYPNNVPQNDEALLLNPITRDPPRRCGSIPAPSHWMRTAHGKASSTSGPPRSSAEHE